MPTQPAKISNLHRGMSSAADFFIGEGFCRNCQNVRFDPKVGVIRRNGTTWLKDYAAGDLDSTRSFGYEALDDVFVVVDPAATGADRVQAFDGDGVEGTIYVQAELVFTSGGVARLYRGDKLSGAISGATATVSRIKHATGAWADGDAAGTIVIYFTSPGTDFQAENVDVVGGQANIFTIAAAQTNELDFTYLDSITKSDVRLHGLEDSIFIVNTQKVITTSTAPTDTVIGDVPDFESLLKKWSAVVGDVYQTIASTLNNPAGHYKCVEVGVRNETTPKWKRIPKPDQIDAIIDAATMQHRLLRLQDSPLELVWEQPGWEPRLSGGDVEGYDETSGSEIILNPPVMKGERIVDMTDFTGSMVYFFTKGFLISVRNDYFNLWINDVSAPAPNDRIFEEIIVPNAGDILFGTVAGGALFIQTVNRQIEYGPLNGELLVAGGEQTPYNGRVRKISDFGSSLTVAPIVSANYVLMLDDEKRLRSFVYLGAEGDHSFVPLVDPLNSIVYDDFIQETPVSLHVIGDTVFCIMSSGLVWTFRVYGVADTRQLRGAWGRFLLDEKIVFWFGYQGVHRILTQFETGHSLLTFRNDEVIPESGFDFENRLDRRETIEASSYDATLDETTFTMKTDADEDETRLIIRHNMGSLFFQQSPHTGGAISVGDTVTGSSSGATGVVLTITLASGGWGTNDAVGSMTIRRTSTARFVDAETLSVAAVDKADTTAAEIVLALKAEVKVPVVGSASGKTIAFKGNYIGAGSGTEHYVGRRFLSNFVLPTIWDGPSKQTLVVVTIAVFHERTSDYVVRLSERNRDDETHNMAAKIIGDVLHGQSPIETDYFEILAGAEGDGLTITLESGSTGQFRFSSLELEIEQNLVS